MIAHVIEYKVLITSANFAFRRTTSFIFIKVKNKKMEKTHVPAQQRRIP